MRTLIIGDVHLGLNLTSYKGTNLSERYAENNIKFIQETIELAKPDKIIFLGDIFDKPKIDPKYLILFKNLLDSLDQEVVLLTGNHDLKSEKDNLLKVFEYENVHPISKITQDENHLYIPYYSLGDLVDVLPTNLNDKIVFSHLDIGYLNPHYMIQPEELNLSEARLIFNGHVHKPYKKNNLINVGSVASTDFSDTEVHSLILYNELENTYELFPNTYIRFLDLQTQFDIDYIYKESELIRNMNPSSMIFLRYNIELEPYVQELHNRFLYDALYPFYIQKEKPNLTVEKVEKSDSFESIENLFRKYMYEKYNIDISQLISLN